MAPLVDHRWPDFEVHFPSLSRTLELPYVTLSSARFHENLYELVEDEIALGRVIEAVEPSRVVLAGGTAVEASCVLDARGAGQPAGPRLWQAFAGFEVELDRPHDVARPIIMDATLPLTDVFRFACVLPLGPTRLLVDEVRLQEEGRLDRAGTRRARGSGSPGAA
jgi:lycopene beta-cyclase